MHNHTKRLLVSSVLTLSVIFSQPVAAEVWPQPESAYNSSTVSPQWVDEKPTSPAPIQPQMQTPYPQGLVQQVPNQVPNLNRGSQPWGNWGGNNGMMPHMPNMNDFNANGMPQMPSMGNWNMPNMDMGNWSMPEMPDVSNMPGMPNMNEMEMPSPSFTIPTVHIPTFN